MYANHIDYLNSQGLHCVRFQVQKQRYICTSIILNEVCEVTLKTGNSYVYNVGVNFKLLEVM